jgi:hypothetical protein
VTGKVAMGLALAVLAMFLALVTVMGAAASSVAGEGGGVGTGASGTFGASTPAGVAGIDPASWSGELPASAEHAVAYAESMVGVPYLYGGSGPSGFDCSGLVWAAYSNTPAAFPRMGARDEFRYTPHLPPGEALLPGDLVFFADAAGIEHVGIYVGADRSGQAVMVDAPHQGAQVRYDVFVATLGARWGDEWYYGATDPAGVS